MNHLLDFVGATVRWWHRPRVRRVAMALLILWLVNALVGTITEKWWCEAQGVGALWTARTLAQSQLFVAFAGFNGALWWALRHFLTPPIQAVPVLNHHSFLVRIIACYAQYGRRATVQIGAFLGWWQSQRAAHWGDEWLLWRNGVDWGERDLSGADWSAWVWGWPLVDGLQRVFWSSVTLALLAGFVLHAAQIAFVSVRRQNDDELCNARRVLWFLGALWFVGLGVRYSWLQAQNAVAWRGDHASVPVGWDWLSWHLTRFTDTSGIVFAVGGFFVCALAATRAASACRAWLRPAWRMAIVAWWLPGALQVLAGGPLWRLMVAPDEMAREAPFRAASYNATRRAWHIEPEVRTVNALPATLLNDSQRKKLALTARVWDEEALQAALSNAKTRVPAALHQDNGRLVGVTTSGVYDATRAVEGRPPLLHTFAVTTNWPPPTTSETRGDVVLKGAARALWTWRLRDFGALWRTYATLHTDWEERTRALLPGARTVDAPYITPEGWLLQNVSGTTPELPGVRRVLAERNQIAQISDAALLSVAPNGETRLWAGRDNEPWLRCWQRLPGIDLPQITAKLSGARTSKSVAGARVQVWNQLVRAEHPDWQCSELEYALLDTPENADGARWVLQGLIKSQTRLAGWLEMGANVTDSAWEIWHIAPHLTRTEPLWPLNEELLSEDTGLAVRAGDVKAARVRSKVWLAPLWRDAVDDTVGTSASAELLLWQSEYEAPIAAWLRVRTMPATGWLLNRTALSDAMHETRVAVGQNTSELLGLWSQTKSQPTRTESELLAARRAAQELSRLLEAEEKALNSGNWPEANVLRQQQRTILDQLK